MIRRSNIAAFGQSVSTSTVLNGVQVYYRLEDLTDSGGAGLTLTNVNSVTFAAGQIGNAATFVDTSSKSLTHIDAAQYQPGTGDWSISAWFNLTNGKTDNILCEYGKVINSFPGYNLRVTGANILATMADGTHLAFKIHSATVNDGAWHLVIATFNRAGNISVYVDNSAAQTADLTAVTGSVNDTQSFGFAIGADTNGSWWDGKIDELIMVNRVWTAGEIAEIWNGGAGKSF